MRVDETEFGVEVTVSPNRHKVVLKRLDVKRSEPSPKNSPITVTRVLPL